VAWQAMGLTTKEGPDVDITRYKYVNGVLTAKTEQEVSDQQAVIAENDLPNVLVEQVLIYGKGLTGEETELQIAQLLQIQKMKMIMRAFLASVIGDYGDNIADVTRALVLAEGIRNGSITNENIVKGYAGYCEAMVTMYVGAQAILDVLNFDLQGLQTYLAPYYPAKDQTVAATTISEVEAVIEPSPPKPIKIG
jgi:hypothetical protein